MSNKYCPICGEENNSKMETVEQGSCWCMNEVRFPNTLLELVPFETIVKQCICKKCVDKNGIYSF
ncbi:hypothetical protein PB01_09855 [Psychrobacillus glaciei]|uniref:Cysteine-rich CWC family protein n=2 Tax=Psychrobacillus glaciei TaxID=2283160 RepID=A0A5J6SME7_9BACI|nr:hypothetical protein PB01_09855 [Psychrobacillus glaciei]